MAWSLGVSTGTGVSFNTLMSTCPGVRCWGCSDDQVCSGPSQDIIVKFGVMVKDVSHPKEMNSVFLSTKENQGSPAQHLQGSGSPAAQRHGK